LKRKRKEKWKEKIIKNKKSKKVGVRKEKNNKKENDKMTKLS
jgi:hypothetical protein